MVDIDTFTRQVESIFEELEPGTLTPDTVFRDALEWSSINALTIMALVETDYNVSITGEELRQCQTVRDLYKIVSSRLAPAA